ncbi:MAG: ATP-binding protein [Clostridiales bacterium]
MLDSIFKKIVFTFVTILIFSFSVTGVILYYTLGNYVIDESKKELDYNMDMTMERIRYLQNDRDELQIMLDYMSSNTNSMIILVGLDANIAILSYEESLQPYVLSIQDKFSDNPDGFHKLTNKKQYEGLLSGEMPELVDDNNFFGLFKDEKVNTWLTVGKPLYLDQVSKKNISGAVYISRPLTYVTKARNEIIKLFVYAVLISTLLALLLFYVLSLKMTRPLQKINVAVKDVSKGDFKGLLKIESNDELGELAKNFNNMVISLNKLEEMRSGFIANVSHELRTPVTSIKGFIEGILDGTITKDRQDEYLLIVKEETIRLTRLVNNLLNLAKIESGSIEIKPVNFDVNEMIRRIIIKFENLIVEKDITINANFEEEYVYVKADKDSIEQVITNLLHNAIKFTDMNGKITINTELKRNKVYVTIEDNGIGIEKRELDRIWERFYKTDKSRSTDKKGAGLGLSIVKNILNENKGKIWVESESNKGTKFTFTLVKASSIK